MTTTSIQRSARERILETAHDLFYREGIRAVGIDTIIERSGVAKMSLYRHFATKDDLVVAYLEERNRDYWDWFDAAIARHPGSPRRQLLDLFAALGPRLRDSDYRGCSYLNVVTEFPDPNHPGHQVARAHKELVRSRLRDLAARAGAADPDRLAVQLLMLLDGARASTQVFGAADAAAPAQAAAIALIDAQLPPDEETPGANALS